MLILLMKVLYGLRHSLSMKLVKDEPLLQLKSLNTLGLGFGQLFTLGLGFHLNTFCLGLGQLFTLGLDFHSLVTGHSWSWSWSTVLLLVLVSTSWSLGFVQLFTLGLGFHSLVTRLSLLVISPLVSAISTGPRNNGSSLNTGGGHL